MIKHLRIDNRLIHGQVAVTWKNYIGAKTIVVCNDKVAADPIQKIALPMAARGTKVLVKTITETALYEKENKEEIIFVICKFPQDALELLQQGVYIETINVGNAAPITGTEYKMVTKSIAVTKEDAKIYRKIAELNGGILYSQMVPTNTKVDFLKVLDEAGL